MGLRERKKQETRTAIQTAALELFAKQGYVATTMAEVARRADVSLRTVAVHFPTKPDLVLADDEAFIDGIIASVEQRAEGVLALDAMQAFIAQGIASMCAEGFDHVAVRELQRVRRQVIEADEELTTRARGKAARIEPVLRTGIAHDLQADEASISVAIVAAGASGVFSMLEALDFGKERDDIDVVQERVLDVLEKAFAFLRAGLAELQRS